jgi:hypothetical protein
MFFARKDSIATITGTQKEFNACQRRGIGFFTAASPSNPANKIWHYLFPAALVEDGIKQALAPARQPGEDSEDLPSPPAYYIWSQEVTIGAPVGDPLITPLGPESDPEFQWKDQAQSIWADAHSA